MTQVWAVGAGVELQEGRAGNSGAGAHTAIHGGPQFVS